MRQDTVDFSNSGYNSLNESYAEDGENNDDDNVCTGTTNTTSKENNQTLLLKLDYNYQSFKIKEMKEVIKNCQEEEIDLFNERERMKKKINELYEEERKMKTQKLNYNNQDFQIKEMDEVIKKYQEQEMNLFNERDIMKQRINELYEQERQMKKQILHHEDLEAKLLKTKQEAEEKKKFEETVDNVPEPDNKIKTELLAKSNRTKKNESNYTASQENNFCSIEKPTPEIIYEFERERKELLAKQKEEKEEREKYFNKQSDHLVSIIKNYHDEILHYHDSFILTQKLLIEKRDSKEKSHVEEKSSCCLFF